MVSNMTVLALVTLLCLATANDKTIHDQLRENMKNSNINDPNNPYAKEFQQINEEVLGAVALFYVIAVCVVAGINIFLCVKCLRKRAISTGIKEQIQMKRMEYATMHGLDMRTLNDPRFSQTIHA